MLVISATARRVRVALISFLFVAIMRRKWPSAVRYHCPRCQPSQKLYFTALSKIVSDGRSVVYRPLEEVMD